jgi:hypothetical protein
MYYYKARLYSATLGRFMQVDPIGYAAASSPVNMTGSAGSPGFGGMAETRASTSPGTVPAAAPALQASSGVAGFARPW